MNSKSGKDGAPVTFSSTVKKVLESAYLKPFCFWLIWMLVGTVFYAYELNTGWAKGFYMAVNVGYSIGWGFPAEDSNGTRVFSTFYVLVGASAVAASLGYFAQSMIDSSQEWYSQALVAEKYKSSTSIERVVAWLQMNMRSIQIIFLWVVFILVLMVYSLIVVEWGWSEALYFAVSSLSTGGLWRIPDDSSQWQFGFVGIIAAVGVPLMGLAMANIAAMVITIGDPDEAEKTIAAKVTLEELQMMQRFNLDDGDGQINRAEYILLCCVRLGALSPDLIGKINERFILLDTSGDGMLSHSEILEYPPEQHTTGNVMHDQDPETGAAAVSNSTNNTCVYSDIPNGNSSPRGNGELDPMMQHKNPVFQPRSPNGENSSGSSSSNVAAMVKSVQMQAITRSSSGPDALTPTVADTTTSNSRKSDMY